MFQVSFFFLKIECQKTLSFYWQFGPENFNIGAQGDFLKLLLLQERHSDKFQ